MAIDRDNAEERQARLDQMINEFEAARQRRLARPARAPVLPDVNIAIAPAGLVSGHEPLDEPDT